MAACKLCERSGWFLSITTEGLCKSCAPLVAIETAQRLRIINDSMELVQKSSRLDTQLSRCDLIVEHAKALVRFEEREIPTVAPPPSETLRTYLIKRDNLIVEGLDREAALAISKATVARNPTSQINQLSKTLLRLQEYKDKLKQPGRLDELGSRLTSLIQAAQLRGYLDSARKAEFKGKLKQALDHYYDALYFLRHDSIDDARQIDHISKIEAKIIELGGEVRS